MKLLLRFSAAALALTLAAGMNTGCSRRSADADDGAATVGASDNSTANDPGVRSADEPAVAAADENSRGAGSAPSSGSSSLYGSDSSSGLSGATSASGTTTKHAANSVGGAIDDAALTARVKGALLADSDIKNLDVSVTTHDNQVTLKGEVDNQTQIERASEIASTVEGVKEVQNRITIKR